MIDSSTQFLVLSDSIGLFFCGAITLLLFIVSIVYLKTLEKIYLHYALFLLFILFYAITNLKEIDGVNSSLLNFLRGNRRYVEPFTLLSFSSYILFAIQLTNLKSQREGLSRGLHAFGMACIVYSFFYFLLFDYIAAHQLSFFIVSRIIIFTLSSYFLWQIYRHIQSPVKLFFLTGSICYFIGSVLASMRHSNFVVPLEVFYTLSASSYFQIGIILQAVFFALALGGRVVFLHQEHASAQRTLIGQLAIQGRVTKEVNKRLEKEIATRVQEVMAIKENLQEQERKRVAAEYERNLIKSEIQAKQAKISPHFMYNSLNAIKFLVLQQQNDNAIKYLVTFSRFIRTVLEWADKDIISLETELSIIQNYLELEKKRFNEDFSFNIVIDPTLELGRYTIPPLLLQPFVENAIWHGLLTSQKEEKRLTIHVERSPAGVKIIIEDNGVGRNVIVSRKSATIHESMGIKLTSERIKLFNYHHHDKKISINFIDLKEDNARPLGTRVELFLVLDQTVNAL